MNTTRNTTLFSIRYAVRVLERNARMWSLIGTIFKFASIISGTVALGAITGDKAQLAVWIGGVFATLQALDHSFEPSTKKAESVSRRRDYARLLATQSSYTDESLEAAYQSIVADDDINVIQSLKELAYNDVVHEQGLDASGCYANHPLMRAMS